MRRRSLSRRPVGPLMLESWWRACPGPRLGRPLHPSGAAGSRARLSLLSATRVSGRVIKFKFASRSKSPLFGPLASLSRPSLRLSINSHKVCVCKNEWCQQAEILLHRPMTSSDSSRGAGDGCPNAASCTLWTHGRRAGPGTCEWRTACPLIKPFITLLFFRV